MACALPAPEGPALFPAMRSVKIRNTSLVTSALGFGCASLTSLNDRARAVELLRVAHDAGITHFDVARAYGLGHAEGIVGEFLRGRRAQVTVTTKFGLQPPSGGIAGAVAGNRRLVGVAKALLKRVPGLAAMARRRARTMITEGAFTPAEAERSLTTSLRELGTDYVDLLLLHECTSADARREDLLAWLDAQVSRGTARHTGVGTSVDRLEGDVGGFPDRYAVFQLDHNARDRHLRTVRGLGERGVVTHGALKYEPRLADAIRARPELASAHSEAVGVDLADAEARAAIQLAYALRDNRDGLVLASTRRAERLRANVRAAEAPTPSDAQLAALECFVDEALTAPSP